jgi:dihydrofolate reductase
LNFCEKEEEVFIIGGASLFSQALSMQEVTTMYITCVHHEFIGDAYFPKFNEKVWKLVRSEEHSVDERHAYLFTFCEYIRKARKISRLFHFFTSK